MKVSTLVWLPMMSEKLKLVASYYCRLLLSSTQVQVAPSINHNVAEEGGHAKYVCRIENYDQSTQVTWYFGMRQLESNEKYEIKYEEGVATMYVKDVSKSDDGTYRCKVVNDYGEDSSYAELFVKGVREISEFGVTITVHPEPRVTWFKSGQKIKPGDDDKKYTFESDKGLYQLVINKVTEEDDAEYSIVARNKYGEDSCKAKLTVIPHPPPADATLRPMFKRLLANAECQEGQNVSFEIRVSGVPKPTLTWEKDGQPLSFGPNFDIIHEGLDYYALHIRDTLPEDSGYYRVTATNSAGSTSCQAYLKVERLKYVKREYKTEEEREKHVQRQIDKTLRMAEILSGVEPVPLTQTAQEALREALIHTSNSSVSYLFHLQISVCNLDILNQMIVKHFTLHCSFLLKANNALFISLKLTI
uniref:Ig-like domain-containing protein n=1 Tax=Anas platyrhynchos platyrhynchos TaxID=8840 RepID=A0A493TT88_ANAPP